MKKTTVCLTMIVKNESKNLRLNFSHLKDYIDQYVIIDTGSTDDTREVIKEIFEGVPGKIVEHEFDDFSTSRNSGMPFITTDWIMMLDADEELSGDLEFLKNLNQVKPDTNGIYIRLVEQTLSMRALRLYKNRPEIKWVLRAHQYLQSTAGWEIEDNYDIFIDHHNNGSNKPNKFKNTLRLLKEDWEELKIPRCAFYIGCTYYWQSMYDEAKNWFKLYYGLDSSWWDEELFKAKLYEGRCYQFLKNYDKALECYKEAGRLKPYLAESFVWAAEVYRILGNNGEAVKLCEKFFLAKEPKTESLWIERDIYNHTIPYILSISSWYVGKMDLGKKACQRLIENYGDVELYKNNLKFYN